jgi:prepilin-type N-terminal cleavage/methylation domain-containing protein
LSTTAEQRRRPERRGFSLVEMLLVVVLLALAVAPMLEALLPSMNAVEQEEESTVFINQARGTLFRAAAKPFDELAGFAGGTVELLMFFGSEAEAAKETFTFRGRTYTPALAVADVSGGAGGLLELTVTLEHVRLQMLRARY